ncbi:MAG: hypothetical protein R8K20_11115 [Gallionellaceae bacterium]
MGAALIYLLPLGREALSMGAVASDPLMVGLLPEYAPIVTATLKQHAWNLAWAGAVATISSYCIWKKSVNAIFISALVGGMVDIGYFIYVDLQGLAPPIGTAMTFFSGGAINLSFYAYFKSDKLQNL